MGRCVECGRRVQGRHPRQTSDALGAAAVHFGPPAVALVVFHKHVGVPLEKIATVLRERFGLTVTRNCCATARRSPKLARCFGIVVPT